MASRFLDRATMWILVPLTETKTTRGEMGEGHRGRKKQEKMAGSSEMPRAPVVCMSYQDEENK